MFQILLWKKSFNNTIQVDKFSLLHSFLAIAFIYELRKDAREFAKEAIFSQILGVLIS